MISSGSLKIDSATGVGGFPRGRIMEIFGAESSGKTSLVTTTLIQAQKKYPDEPVAFIDVENAYDITYAKEMGLDISEDRFIFCQPSSGNEALDILLSLAEAGVCPVIALDSVAGLTTERENEADIGQATMAELPRLLGTFMKKLAPVARKTNTLCIFINQIRANLAYGANEEIERAHV